MFFLKNNFFTILIVLFIFIFSVFDFGINSVQATAVSHSPVLIAKLGGLSSTAYQAGFPKNSVVSIIGNTLKVIFSLVGVIFLLLIIYGGILWMTGGGNEKTAGKAKKIITAAAIGLIVVLAAYAITTFISSSIMP